MTAANFDIGNGQSDSSTNVARIVLGGLHPLYTLFGVSLHDGDYSFSPGPNSFSLGINPFASHSYYSGTERTPAIGADPWHILLALAALIVLVVGVWRGRSYLRRPFVLAVGLTVGYLLFTAVARWSEFNVRTNYLPLLVVWAAIIAIAAAEFPRWVARLLMIGLLVASLPQLLNNGGRPLVPPASSRGSYLEPYFVGGHALFRLGRGRLPGRDQRTERVHLPPSRHRKLDPARVSALGRSSTRPLAGSAERLRHPQSDQTSPTAVPAVRMDHSAEQPLPGPGQRDHQHSRTGHRHLHRRRQRSHHPDAGRRIHQCGPKRNPPARGRLVPAGIGRQPGPRQSWVALRLRQASRPGEARPGLAPQCPRTQPGHGARGWSEHGSVDIGLGTSDSNSRLHRGENRIELETMASRATSLTTDHRRRCEPR